MCKWAACATVITLCAVTAMGVDTSSAQSAPATRPATNESLSNDAANSADADLGELPASGAHSSSMPRSPQEAPELLLYNDLPIVVAATKHEQTLQQAPASVTVVSDEEIELFNYQSLADVLRNQRSFYLDTDGLNWFAGTRGFLRPGEWNARLLILTDDRPDNEIIYGQTHLDLDFVVPMEAVKQVEIDRGPGSAVYGTNAVFGVIDVITKNGADVNGLDVKLTGGTLDTGQINLLYGKQIDGWDVLADFNIYHSPGENQLHYDGVSGTDFNNGNIDNFDGEGAYQGFVKVSKGELTFEADYARREKDNDAATYLTSFYDPGTMHEQIGDATLRFDHDMGNGQSLHGMAYYGFYGYQQDLPFAADGSDLGPAAYVYTTTAYDDWVGEEIHYDWQATKMFHFLVGADGRQALTAVQRDYDTLQGQILDVPSSYNSAAIFAQAEIKATDWLNFTVGGRADRIQRLGTSLSPRFAAIVNPTSEDAIKALYGRAFREPNLYELFYDSPGTNTSNPNLKAEVVDTYELDWERHFKDGWQTTLDGYVWKMFNAMDDVTLGDGSVQTQNVGDSMATGIEGEVQKRWENGGSFRAYASYTWADYNGQLPTLSPKWIVGTAVAIPVINRNNFISIAPQIVGPMQSDLGVFTNPTYITNVVFTSRDLFKGWTLQAGAYNLFAAAARLPRDDAFNQAQTNLRYPATMFQISISRKF